MTRTFEDPILTRIHGILRAEVDPDFHFLEPGPLPFVKPSKPASNLRVALLTTASLHLKGDVPFRALEEPLGDTSFRTIPFSAKPEDLDLDAPYVDRRHIPQDPEVALPLRTLESLHRDGSAGPPAPRHASVSGGIVRPYPGLAETSENLAAIFREDGVYCYGPNTGFDGCLGGSYHGSYRLTAEFPALPLLGGGYEVSVAFYDKDHVYAYAWDHRLYPFRVAADRRDHGVVLLHHRFSVSKLD